MKRTCLLLALTMAAAPGPGPGPRPAAAQERDKSRTVELSGVDAARFLFNSGKYPDAEKWTYPVLWDDIRQPEALHILSQSLFKLGRREEAATWYRVLLRVAEDFPSTDADKFKPHGERFLKFGDKDHDARVKQYDAQAGGKFDGPEKVSDLWMTQVKADLHSLRALKGWKIIEANVKDADMRVIHNAQGAMHRSGMKLVPEVQGRKGVLFTIPHPRKAAAGAEKDGKKDAKEKEQAPKDKAAAPNLFDPKGAGDKPSPRDMEGAELGRPTRVTIPWRGKGKVLRIGARAYETPFLLEVFVKGSKLAEQRVETKAWVDFKIELPAGMKAGDAVTLELATPAGASWSEGAWLDYVDFFAD